jgi:two-component system sensor histidine kinase BaeS
MISYIRSHLSLKLFFSYLVVILVFACVLSVSVYLAAPQAFNRHMLNMQTAEGQGMQGMMQGQATSPGRGFGGMMGGLFANFLLAVRDSLTWAALAATLAGVLASILIARQVVAPVQAMRDASQRIAHGHYNERVALPDGKSEGELDELGRLALSFNEMAQRLEQTEAMRRQLIGDVAHELRTPLTTIRGSAEGLIDGILPPEIETFQQIYRESERLGRLVEDLQELSRVEAGAYELNRSPVVVRDLVQSVVERLGRQYNDKGVGLDTHIPEELPHVLVDEYRIGQVFTNLVGNALQYTPQAGRVVISAVAETNFVRISVADTGAGLAIEHLEHVFDRFYRVDKSRSRAAGGSGIGLTIARYLVEAHGGRIWAESSGEGQGSTFTFTLPALKTTG